jgi:hypothetical protein
LRTGLCLLALVLIGTVAAGTVFAEEAASGAHSDGKGSAAHGDGKGSAAPAGERGDGASSRGHGEGGGAKGDAQTSPGDDNKGQKSGASDRAKTAKDAGPSESAKGSRSPEPYFPPPRRLDKRKGTPGQDNATAHSAKPNLNRRLSRVPQPPDPVRNAIRAPLPPHENTEQRDDAHPSPAVPHPPAAAPVVPGNVTGRLGKTEGVNQPISNPVLPPPAANRGAINGTGVTHHNIGPPRIGGPTASVVSVNGTAIVPKH